jgi:rhodanese-related sulfurtransferase
VRRYDETSGDLIRNRGSVVTPDDVKTKIFVVYCTGPHCNGADRAAVRLARLGRPVKKMIGGIEGWKDEGFELTPE